MHIHKLNQDVRARRNMRWEGAGFGKGRHRPGLEQWGESMHKKVGAIATIYLLIFASLVSEVIKLSSKKENDLPYWCPS